MMVVQELYLDILWYFQKKLESAHREAQVLEIKRQGQMKALEAQRAKKEVCCFHGAADTTSCQPSQ